MKLPFTLFMALLLNMLIGLSGFGQIIYPDHATYDFTQKSTLINFEVYNSAYPAYNFGPDAAIQLFSESDSVVAKFGHSDIHVQVKAASIDEFADPSKVRIQISSDETTGHYKGTNDPEPGNYDYLIWPHTNSFEGSDGHLYSIAYLEFTGWTVYGYNSAECPSSNVGAIAFECWMSAAILVRSTDGGLSWDKVGSSPEEYVVASSPYKYREQNNTGRHGVFPTETGADFGLRKVGEHYYIEVEFWGEDFKIKSMARTTDITDARSWRFFDGEDFSLANVNPYTQEISNPASHLPPPIENYYPLNFNPNKLPVEGLIYSTYFQKYISIRTRSFSFAPEVTPGIYYYLSEDGFNWSGNAMLFPFEDNLQSFNYPGDSEPYWPMYYPSLIDQTVIGSDIGQQAYLVYVAPKLNSGAYDAALNAQRDIIILPIEFATHQVSGFEITHSGLNIPEDSNPGDGYCDNGFGRCSFITAITESEARPHWADTSTPLTITIANTAPDTLEEDYAPRITKPTIIDGTQNQNFSANSTQITDGWNGSYGVHLEPGITFERGTGHELKGVDVYSVLVGGGEEGDHQASIHITGSKIHTLTLTTAHSDGVIVGGMSADSANIIGQLVFDGGNNIIRGNHIGHDGSNSMVPSDETVVEMNANNRLEGNVIASKSNILMNFGSSDASGNTVKNNYFGSLPWSTTALGSSSAAIKIVEAQANHFEGNTIQHSNTSDGEAAVFVLDANENLFYSNRISNNTGHGIHISGSSAGNIIGTPSKGNIIHDNTGVGVNFLVNTEVGNPVKSNRIYNNGLGSIANYTNIIPLGVPTLLSAFVHPNNDSLTIRHGGIEDLDTAPYRIDVFSNTTEPTLPQGETVLASDVLVDSTQLQRGGVRIPYSGSAGGYLSMTLTDSRPVTSEFTNTVQLLNASESPIASYSTMNISKNHTTDWFSEEILSISNIGGSTLKLSLLENLEWISVEPNTVSLANGESTELTITFDSRTLSEDIAAHTAAIRIVSNEMNPSLAELPVEIIFDPSSSGSPELSLSTDTLVASYTKPTENTTGTASFTLYNQSADSINWMVFKNQPWITGLEPAGGKIKDSVEVTTTFRLRPQDPIGIRNATVTVAAYFDGSQEQTQIELPVRLVLTDDEQEELPTVSFNPTELTFTDSVQIGDSWEGIVEVDINNLGTPGVNFQFLQSFTSFVTSNPFNGEITQSGKVQLTFSFDNIQEAILMDTSVTYRFFYPDKPVVELSIPVSITIGLIEKVIEPLPKIEFAIAPDSLFMVQQITLGDTLRIDEALLIKNLGEVGLNWELNLPNTPTTAPKLAGVVNDSLVVPILLEIPDITESTTLSETLGLELWYERIRNGESQRIDSLVRIPLVIQVDVISVSNEWLGDTPSEIVLYQNYPNPFNPSTQIRFALPSSKHVQLSVYNVSGQMVVELINGQMPAGVHHINFDAQGLSSGTYIYQLKSSDGVLSKKLLLIK
jgi:parallel beta-helix repeat protein